MHKMIEELYDLCEVLEKDLKKTNEKLRKSNGELSGPDLEYIDKLTHSIKSIKGVICMTEDADGGYSQAGDWEATGRMSGNYGRGNSYANRGQHYVRSHYSRDSGRSEVMKHIEMAMDVANEQDRENIKRFMRQLENS